MSGPVGYFPGKRNYLVRIYKRAKGDRFYFSVKWCDPDSGLMVKKDRSTLVKAEALAREVCDELEKRQSGLRVERLSHDDRRRLELSRRVPVDKLADWVGEWESMSRQVTVGEWIECWLADEGHEWAKKTREDYGFRLAVFARAFGDRYLDEVSADDLVEWRAGFLKGKSKASKRNANNYLAAVRALFKGARDRGHLPEGRETAADKVRAFKKVKGEILIFEVDQVARMLAELPENPKHAVYFLLSVFMPFRPSDLIGVKGERAGLTWEAFRWDECLVDLPPSIAGKGRGRMMEIPPVLAEWLLRYRRDGGQVARTDSNHWCSRHYRECFPGLVWQSDVLRHTAISHLLARTRNEIGWVADQAGNSEAEIRRTYRVPRTEADGRLFFELTPGKVERLCGESELAEAKVISISS
jgi:integrase